MIKKWPLIPALLIIGMVTASCVRLKNWKEVHSPPDEICSHCHYDIYKSWKVSYRPYNEAMKQEDYIPVHSQPKSASDVMMKKSHSEGKGDCSQCHFVEPMQELLTISRIGINFKDTVYQLCGRCHVNLFNDWARSSYFTKEKGCLTCHADREGRPVEDKKGYHQRLTGIEGAQIRSVKPGLSPEELKKAASITHDVQLRDGKVTALFIIANTGTGHNLPADRTNTAYILLLSLKEPSGKIIDNKEVIVLGWGKKFLEHSKQTYLDIEMVPSTGSDYILEVTLKRESKRAMKESSIIIYHENVEVKTFPQ